MAKTLTAKFPCVKHFIDYHDIDYHADDLKELFGCRIGSSEIGLGDNRRYWAVFYTGRKPNKAVIKALLDGANYTPMHDDEE